MEGKDIKDQDDVLVFTRMEADGFDEFMSDPMAVIATVEDIGFSQDDMMTALNLETSDNGGDPAQLQQLIEERWNGEGMNFSFEHLWGSFLDKCPDAAVLKMITEEGRRSQIHTECCEIRVLSQDQVNRACDGLSKLQLKNLDSQNESDIMLESLFRALQVFFSCAAEAKEFVLVSYT